MFDSHEDLSIFRYDGEFDPAQQGLESTKPFEFIDEPTVICDLSNIISRVRLWQEKLPKVALLYPVRFNSDPVVLRVLDRLGVKFSCVSKDEIRAMRMKGVIPDDIHFANPVKIISHIRCAQKQQVTLLTVDCVDELEKVKMYHPEAKLILKIKSNSNDNQVIGCDPKTDALKLMMEAKDLDLNLVGISFEIESKPFDAEEYKSMLITTRTLFNYGKGIGLKFDTIGLGGGIPGTIDAETFTHFAAVISKTITELFPDPSIRIIAEPAAFLVAPSMTLFCTIQARKEIIYEGDSHKMAYYVNYGGRSFGSQVEAIPKWIESDPQEDTTSYSSIIFGATSERKDVLARSKDMPLMFVGDILYFENISISKSFNYGGFRSPIVKYYLKQSCKIIL